MNFDSIVTVAGKKTRSGSSNQERSLSAFKNGVNPDPYCWWNRVPTTISISLDIIKDPGWYFLLQGSLQWALLSMNVWFIHKLTLWFYYRFWPNEMAILLKVYKPRNFELDSSQRLSFINIWGFRSNFISRDSFLESNSDIFAYLRQA